MSTFNSFEDMDVWRKSMRLVTEIYRITASKHFSRDYNLTNQIRKSSVSIASNIAEGFERDGNKEFVNYLYIAKGSCGELRCQLNIALNLNYLDDEGFIELSDSAKEISRSLNKLIKYLKASEIKGRKYKNP